MIANSGSQHQLEHQTLSLFIWFILHNIWHFVNRMEIKAKCLNSFIAKRSTPMHVQWRSEKLQKIYLVEIQGL